MKHRLTISTCVLVALGALATAAVRSRASITELDTPARMLGMLGKHDITRLEIAFPGRAPLDLSKQNGTWQMTAPLATRADDATIDRIVTDLSAMQVGAIATTHRAHHARLEVTPDLGIHLKAEASGKLVLDVYVGAVRSGGAMVREEGSDTVFAVRTDLRADLDKEVKGYRNRVVTDFDPASVTALSIESANGTFRFVRPDNAWGQAAGEKPILNFGPTKVANLVSALARLRALDFAPAAKTSRELGFDLPRAKLEFTRRDGSVVQLMLGYEADKVGYLMVSGDPVIYSVVVSTASLMMPGEAAFAGTEPVQLDPAAKDALIAKLRQQGNFNAGQHGETGGLPANFIADLKRAGSMEPEQAVPPVKGR